MVYQMANGVYGHPEGLEASAYRQVIVDVFYNWQNMRKFLKPLNMKFPFFLIALLVIGISTTAQITADNGLTNSSGNVQLGGSLIQSTSIDLGNSYDLIF